MKEVAYEFSLKDFAKTSGWDFSGEIDFLWGRIQDDMEAEQGLGKLDITGEDAWEREKKKRFEEAYNSLRIQFVFFPEKKEGYYSIGTREDVRNVVSYWFYEDEYDEIFTEANLFHNKQI